MAFILHYREDVGDPLDFTLLSDDIETAGDQVRNFLDENSGEILSTDTILMSGEADFGSTYTLLLTPAWYRGPTLEEGYAPARWYTHTMIDAVGVTKPSGTSGFTFTSYVRFENFYLGGACSDPHEDGGLLGWKADYSGDGVAEFVNCEIDASQGMDWGIYTWQNSTGIRRTVRITDSVFRFCRFGVALSGDGWQSAELTRVKGFGDANGSQSYGTSSSLGLNPGDDGAVLTLLYNRGAAGSPYIWMVDCDVEAIGLTAPFNGSWGCPRIAALATNCYERGLNNPQDHPTAPNTPRTDLVTGHTSYFIRCSTRITPGITDPAKVFDIDIRERAGSPVIRELSAMPTPATYPNAVVWQPTAANLCWLGAVGSSANPTATDDIIANAEVLISTRVLTPNASGKGPKWRGSGWMWFGQDGSDNRNLTLGTVAATSSLNNHFHVDGTGHFLARIKLDAVNSNFKCIVSNCRLTTGHTGFGVRLNSLSQVTCLIYVSGSAILTLNLGTINDSNEHVIEWVAAPGSNATWGRIDWGTKTFGTIGTLAAGGTPSTEQFTIGARSNFSADQFGGRIRDLLIASEELPQEYVDNWRTRLGGGMAAIQHRRRG